MNRFFKYFIVLLLMLFPLSVHADSKYNVYLFYGDGCPHCAEEEEFFEEYLVKNEDINLIKYEVWNSQDNRELLVKVQNEINNHTSGVPYLVVGEKAIVGYLNGVTNKEIEQEIDNYKSKKKRIDVIETINKGEHIDNDKKDEPKKENKELDIPILGRINVKTVSLPLLSIVLGIVDGFNPCAMWVLIILLTMLIGMKDKKKLVILGSTFLLTSGLCYFVLMFLFKELATISLSIVFKMIIAIFALLAGGYNLYNFFKSLKKDDGCNVTNEKQRKTIMTKIKKFTNEKNIILAIIGVIALAVGINFVELLCSAGLPAIFSTVLSINKVNGIMCMIYILIYIIFFMLDDFIIFIIAVKTMSIKVISTKLAKYSHLIAGIIMLIIGILLIFKPSWIMFNF